MASDALEISVAEFCPFSHRCLLVLREKRLDFQTVDVDLPNKDSRSVYLSPYGRVPVLLHRGRRIFESGIINEYIEEVFPDRPLMPRAPDAAAEVKFWVDFCNSRIVPAYFHLMKEDDRGAWPDLREALARWLLFFEEYAFARREGGFVVGPELSLADFAIYPFFERFVSAEVFRAAEVPAECQRVRRWLELMTEQESVRHYQKDRDVYVEYFSRYFSIEN